MTAQWHSQTPHFFARRSACRNSHPHACSAGSLPLRRMNLEPLLIFELALLGLATGFLAGLLGIGGGMLMVPFITIIMSGRGYPPDYTVKMAVATSLATICFTSLSSVRAHHRRGAVLWPIVRLLTPGILLGSLVGAQVAVALPGKTLSVQK